MIPHLKKLESMPVARTNIVQLQESPEQLIPHLLNPVSHLYVIDVGLRTIPKERAEKLRIYSARVHREVKQLIGTALGLDASAAIHYELISLGMGKFAFFYINQAAAPDSQQQQSLIERVHDLCTQQATEPHQLHRLVQGLFSLHIKIALLEQTAELFTVEPLYINAELYLNPQLTTSPNSKTGHGVLEAFKLNVFFSEQQELVFTLKKSKFSITTADELSVTLDEESIWFNTACGRVNATRALDARDSKLDFFKVRSDYGASQAYTYNLVMDIVEDRLADLAMPFSDITFQATHEVDNYISDIDEQLHNPVFVVNAGVNFTDQQQTLFSHYLDEQFPQYTWLSAAEFTAVWEENAKDWQGRASILVLNPVPTGAKNSIRNLSDDPPAQYNDFFKAYAAHRQHPHQQWDAYTTLKINRLAGWLAERPQPAVLQGLNVDDDMIRALDYITELKVADPIQFAQDVAHPTGKLRNSIKAICGKLTRTKTELWLKEALFSHKAIPTINVSPGHYSAYFTQALNKGKNKTYLLGYVEMRAQDSGITITAAGVTEGDLSWLAIEHPALARLSSLYSQGHYLYDHQQDALLTAYHSIRVPRIIGPTAFSVVDAYAHQEEEKIQGEASNEAFSDWTITRTAKPEVNVLPYYIATGRSSKDPLAKPPKLNKHHIYLQPHAHGLYAFMSAAQPTNERIAKQILMENILVWDAKGNALAPFTHSLTGVYLNSFTLDMLKSSESSKTSIFTKLAKLMVKN